MSARLQLAGASTEEVAKPRSPACSDHLPAASSRRSSPGLYRQQVEPEGCATTASCLAESVTAQQPALSSDTSINRPNATPSSQREETWMIFDKTANFVLIPNQSRLGLACLIFPSLLRPGS